MRKTEIAKSWEKVEEIQGQWKRIEMIVINHKETEKRIKERGIWKKR